MLSLAKSRFSRASVYTWATVVGVILSTGGQPSLPILFLAPLSTFLMSLGIYVLNDMVDLDADMINAPHRPLASQSANRVDALTLFSLLNFGGLIIGLWMGLTAFAITLAMLMLGITYSMKPFSFKDRFLAKTLAIGAGGILASIFGGVAAGNVNAAVVYAATMFLVFLFATSPINDLADYVGDKAQGRRTIPIIIGPKKTVRLAILASITPLISSLLFLSELGLNISAVVLLGLLVIRSIHLLSPLMNENPDPKTVRKQHKRMVPLHFLLQGAISAGKLLPVI